MSHTPSASHPVISEEPAHLTDVIVFFNGDPEDWKYGTAFSFEKTRTLPSVLRQTLDTTEAIRKFAHALAWKRTVQWSRSPWSMPVAPITNPHARPEKLVAIVAWTDSGDSAQDLTRDHEVTGSTYGPSLARRLYMAETEGFALANADDPSTAEPVAMTMQWKRMADPMAGFFD